MFTVWFFIRPGNRGQEGLDTDVGENVIVNHWMG